MVQIMSTSKYIFIGTTKHSARRFTWLKFVLASVFVLGTFLYIIDISSLNWTPFKFPSLVLVNGAENEPWSWEFVHHEDMQRTEVYKSYLIDEPGCRMPRFNVTDAKVAKFVSVEQAADCGRPLTRANNHFVWVDLNETEIANEYGIEDVDELSCAIEPFTRKNDFTNEYAKHKYYFKFGDIVKVNEEFVRVVCYNSTQGKVYHDYHYFVGNSEVVHMRNETEESPTKKADPKMNVLILGLDSVSRLNFYRQLNGSANVLLNRMRAFELFGYNKVGDNTYPNMIPVFTGLDEDELAAGCRPLNNMTFDQCRFIWDDYKAKNYSTGYFEDVASMALFQYFRAGFGKSPTDFYNRPLLVELEHHVASQESGNVHLCLGKRRTFQVLFDQFEKFVMMMAERPDHPFFSIFWQASYTHDWLNIPSVVDDELIRLVQLMNTTKTLDNTFLMLMSDHGMRWGYFRNTYQGMMEERQPFLFLIPPTWFIEKYPAAMRNLVQNRRRLTTHFDLHETLQDLLHPETLTADAIKQRTADLIDSDPMPRGISLFLPVPPQRSCYEAAIAPHWCTCHEKAILPTTDPRVERAARMIVDTMNQMVKVNDKCQKLYLNSIFDANLLTANDAIGNVTKHFVDITVRLQTKPGLGEFEATVRLDDDDGPELTGTISRTNLYGNQSECIDDTKLKLYCFCDSLL